MSVTRDELTAFADGGLPPDRRAVVEAAIAADPELARQLLAERRLSAALKGQFDPVLEEPVPAALAALLTRAADEPETQATRAASAVAADVLDFAAARERREQAKKKAARTARVPVFANPRLGFALAASLVLGIMLGTQFHSEGQITADDDGLRASGKLASDLDEQLASVGTSGDLRILTSFRRQDGEFCRVFDGGGTAGIACKDTRGWRLERTVRKGQLATGEYRQAGSAEAELMTVAQEMAQGDPLDADQERAAKDGGWIGSRR